MGEIIDVSHHQGTINWRQVRESGIVSGAYLKISEGKAFVDSRKSRNAQGCLANGVPFGGYHYVRLSESPAVNVNHFLQQLPEGWTLPPMWDLETIGNETALTRGRGFVTNHTLNCLERLAVALGTQPLIYTFATFPNSYLERTTELAQLLAQYPLWVAHYTKAPSPTVPLPWKSWQMWQYTSSGTVPGIAGRVDMNRGNPTTIPVPQPPSNGDEMDPVTLILITMSALKITATRQGVDYWYARFNNPNDLNGDTGKLFRAMAEADGNPAT